METILLSIKPEYVERIFKGTKLFEYRKRLPRKGVKKIIIYVTFPIMKVVGEVEIIESLSGSPSSIWEKTKNNSGISRAKYREYFSNCKTAYAYQLGSVHKFDEEKTLKDFGVSNPPQSFVYIKNWEV
ncbi:MAG: hypothetical protein LBD02_08565 [Christensenellaceae bacterium]|nr:hypothetical protein [Christensenellaceae bacterium]